VCGDGEETGDDDDDDGDDDDDAGISGIPASDGSTEDAGAGDGDAQTSGATEAGTADACHAVHLSTGMTMAR